MPGHRPIFAHVIGDDECGNAVFSPVDPSGQGPEAPGCAWPGHGLRGAGLVAPCAKDPRHPGDNGTGRTDRPPDDVHPADWVTARATLAIAGFAVSSLAEAAMYEAPGAARRAAPPREGS